MNLLHCFISKTDENSEVDRLGFILPAHEYFHQSMVVADCESALFRDSSRGLEGGSFFLATILNRKEAKTGKGKDSIDPIKDFLLIKADARFCQYFIKKYNLNPDIDNTPDLMKSATNDQKEIFVHTKVEEALRDLLPFFRSCRNEDPQLDDHPLQEGRRAKFQTARVSTRKEPTLEHPTLINDTVIENTIQQLQNSLPDQDLVEQNMEKISHNLSGTRSTVLYSCKICSFQSKYKTVCIAHVGVCLDLHRTEVSDLERTSPVSSTDESSPAVADPDENIDDIKGDTFFNYKNSEFFMDAIFGVTTYFEKFGDGLGCYIVNKLLLPIFHGLHHSNYSNSIHRFITRVLCEATPKEALKLVHERFSNRVGKRGHNVPRDRRMEYRIGTAKKLIANLGPNFSQDAVQQINCTLDVKEELFLNMRDSHGVNIRSGRHNSRSDAKDYDMLCSSLTDTRAHMRIEGREFGAFTFAEDLMEDERFDKVAFYRWIVTKNKEAMSVLTAKKKTITSS